MSFFEELKRRNVFRVGIAYVLLGWVVLQAADFALDLIDAPNWIIQALFIIGLAGLPVALFFAWAFELTPEGIKREEDVDRSSSIAPTTGRKLDRAIIFFLAAAVALLLVDRFFGVGERPQAAPDLAETEASAEATGEPDKTSIAVLPFENMSPDPENEYFADGISEEILNVMAGVPDLRVIARTSAFSFKGSDATVAEIADELEVGYLLEGSVRKAGDRVRITAQLIQTSNESHLWSETYDRDLDDIFAVQDEIARAISTELKLHLTPEQQQSMVVASTDNIEAYNAYLRGRQLWHGRGEAGLFASIEALEQAVTLDPQFAPAWAALADAYVLLPEYRNGLEHESQIYIPKARDAVNRALELNPALAQAYTTRGYIRYQYDFDWDNAEKDLVRGIELDPAYPTAHQWYGEYLSVRYRDADSALEKIMEAAKLDPLAPVMWHVAGSVAGSRGRFEEALNYYQKALQIDPEFENTYWNLSGLYTRTGEEELARENFVRFCELAGIDPGTGPSISQAMRDPIARDQWMQFLENGLLRSGTTFSARMYMLLGESDLAMDDLEKGLAEGDPYATYANRSSLYDPLRENPRFQAHLAKMNLWPPVERP